MELLSFVAGCVFMLGLLFIFIELCFINYRLAKYGRKVEDRLFVLESHHAETNRLLREQNQYYEEKVSIAASGGEGPSR